MELTLKRGLIIFFCGLVMGVMLIEAGRRREPVAEPLAVVDSGNPDWIDGYNAGSADAYANCMAIDIENGCEDISQEGASDQNPSRYLGNRAVDRVAS